MRTAEQHGQQLIEELEQTLNSTYESRADYREAIEAAHCHLEVILRGLEDDDRRDEEGAWVNSTHSAKR